MKSLFMQVLLVVCLSTNGERALNYIIVKQLILTNTQFTIIVYAVKGIQCHNNRSPQLFELKKKQQNQVTLFKNFCDILNGSCNAQYFHTTEHTQRKTYLCGSSSGQ